MSAPPLVPDVLPAPLPRSAWLIPLLGLAAGAVQLLTQGVRAPWEPDTALSMVLGALVVAWVSAGVLAGRVVRQWIAVGLMGLTCGFGGLSFLLGPDLSDALVLALDVGALVALVSLLGSPYHRWQRRHHDTAGVPGVAEVLLLACCVGVLGGLQQTDQSREGFHVRVST